MPRYKKSDARSYCKQNMKGIWAAIPYPFDGNDNIDEKAFRKDLRYYIDELNIQGFFVGGMIGEFWCLTKEERLRGQEIACDEAGEVPIIAHTGHTSVKEAIELTNAAAKAGATYAILANPYLGAQGHPERVRAFFKEFCDNVELGVSLFNTGATGYSLTPELVRALVNDNENLCCIKNAQPKYHCDEMREAVGDDIVVSDPMETQWFFSRAYHKQQTFMSGPDPFLLQRKGNLPMERYTNLIDAGNLEEAWTAREAMNGARRVAEKWLWGPWSRGAFPIPALKSWMDLMGMAGGPSRAPMIPLTAGEKKELAQDLSAVGLID
ncbi:MAG: dihydrodipicolinate synthase family protein [bacterium]|nr:dihydrodipicolinate synthase family protein [bacterium]